MTEPWVTPEVYSIISPGVIAGFVAGLYGVLTGLLVQNKNFRQYFLIMTVTALLVCAGLIIIGVLSTIFSQPENYFFDFVSAGLIGVVVIVGVWYTINQFKLSKGTGK